MLDITSHVYPTERATTQFSEQNYLKHRLDHTETFIRLIIGTDRSLSVKALMQLELRILAFIK